jgi:acetyltransferase (GNAT) family protein
MFRERATVSYAGRFRRRGSNLITLEVMDVRAYSPADRAACLAVFDSNTPRFFDLAERRDFETFLDAVDCSYFVMEHDGAIAGCGGYAIAVDTSLASLVGGMVRADLHKLGLGRFLLLYRLREITKAGGVQLVRLGTGFKATGIRKDGYASGMDRIEMMMKLTVCA